MITITTHPKGRYLPTQLTPSTTITTAMTSRIKQPSRWSVSEWSKTIDCWIGSGSSWWGLHIKYYSEIDKQPESHHNKWESVRLLNGESKNNALASGITAEGQVSDMLKMLDSSKSKNVKYNSLKAKLQELQCRNTFMQFTLCKEIVKEMMQHQFESPPNKKKMMSRFTPFCLQKLDERSKID